MSINMQTLYMTDMYDSPHKSTIKWQTEPQKDEAARRNRQHYNTVLDITFDVGQINVVLSDPLTTSETLIQSETIDYDIYIIYITFTTS